MQTLQENLSNSNIKQAFLDIINGYHQYHDIIDIQETL